MPFAPATAEQIVAVVEAVYSHRRPSTSQLVADFLDVGQDVAVKALQLATHLGLLAENGGQYSAANPLCRFFATADQMQKAAVLRVVLESYEPFTMFRERLEATQVATTAAQQTKVMLGLQPHREEVKDTLISLGTYTNAFAHEGGGRYRSDAAPISNSLMSLAEACNDMAAAEARIRIQLAPTASTAVSRDDVILPLADALLKATARDARGAVVNAGNAVESYLVALAARVPVNIAGANGINAKLDRFGAAHWPSKLLQIGKYLGNIRNAADHGIDPEVNATWQISESTGLQYVYVACSFIAAATEREHGNSLI